MYYFYGVETLSIVQSICAHKATLRDAFGCIVFSTCNSFFRLQIRLRSDTVSSATMLEQLKTKGQMEARISEAIIQFEKDYMGRGPTESKTYLVDNMVIIRLQGVLTPAETQLISSDASDSGRELVKKMRHALLQKARPKLEALIKDILGAGIRCLHSDLSTVTGERVIIFTLDKTPHILESDFPV